MTDTRRSPQARVVALVPAHEAAGFIEETLRSLAAQTYENLRVLVSVDRSRDDTAARCAAFARNDPRFTVVVQPERLGWIGNTNALIRLAEGDLGFLLGHDDLVDPEYVTRLTAAILGNPRAALAFADAEVHAPGTPNEIIRFTDLDGVTDRVERGRRLLGHTRPWWVAYRGLFHLDAARGIGGLRRHLGGEFVADWPFLLRLALLGKWVRVPEVLYRKRYRSTSLSRQWRYGNFQWLAAHVAFASAVAAADLTTTERLILQAAVARGIGAGLGRWLRTSVDRLTGISQP